MISANYYEHLSSEQSTTRLFEEEWRTVCRQCGGEFSAMRAKCPVWWLVPELLRLVEELADEPVQSLRPIIRQRLAEQEFVDDCGDSVVERADEQYLDQYADRLVHVLEKVRQRALARGEWSQMPMTPQMFG
jgi:hypothetical protein